MKSLALRLVPWALPLALLAVWQTLASAGFIPHQKLPAPLDVARSAVQLTASGELPRHVGESFLRAISGLLIGGALGFTLGVTNGLSRWAERISDTSLQMLRTVPNLALIPLVIAWFGIGEESKLLLIVLGVLFPIYLNTYHGIRGIDPKLIEMGRVYGLDGWQLITQVILPGALPSILVGVRFALGVMWVTLIVAETIAANSGIGYMINNARDFMQTEIIVLGILLYAVLGKLADLVARFFEGRCLAWHPNHQTPA